MSDFDQDEAAKRAGNGKCNGHNSDKVNVQTIPECTEAKRTCQSEPDEVSICLNHLELDASFWADLLKRKLGIETVEALDDVRWHLLPFLVQFVRKPEEKKALKKLFLNKHHDPFGKGIRSEEWLPLFEVQLQTLIEFHKVDKYRSDEDVQKVESRIRKMLTVPESAWFYKEAELKEVHDTLKRMLVNISTAMSASKNWDKEEEAFCFHLKGVMTTENSCNVSVRGDILHIPKDIHLDTPLRAQFCQQLHFKSKRNEDTFFEHIKIFGCSLLSRDGDTMMECNDGNEGYCSTIKYCFVPMVSGSVENHHLFLSEDALLHLKRIEKTLMNEVDAQTLMNEVDALQFEKQCKYFFDQFGAHALSGPVHFGGLFIWKCYSIGYSASERHQIQQLQKDVIKVTSMMHFPIDKRVSSMDKVLTGYSEVMRDKTYIQTLTIGGPPDSEIAGFPDWKYVLSRQNRTWKMIDQGLSQIAVWDIIQMNHAEDFKVNELLAKKIKEQWAKETDTHLEDEILWSVVGTTIEMSQCEDFKSLQQYCESALEMISESSDVIHPHKAMRITIHIENAVCRLRKTFSKTEQSMSDCLLVTILNPLGYSPVNRRFSSALTRSDIEYLCDKIIPLHSEFTLVQRENFPLKVQSYLLYLTVFLCDMFGTSQVHIKHHIQFITEKMSPLAFEVSSCLESQQRDVNWSRFQSQMELFYKDDSFVNCKTITLNPKTVKQSIPNQSMMKPNIMQLFDVLGLIKYFPRKLSRHEAFQIRDDVYKQPNSDPKLYPFIMLQKIMMFDPNCRISFPNHYDDIEDENELHKIHPRDGLLALLHCSDNFVRQDILSRLAACKLAVPLLLPDPITREPTFLLWAMRSIVNEYLSHDETSYSDRIVTFPTVFISFLRIGNPLISKSEILNGIFNVDKPSSKCDVFLSSNSPGCTTGGIISDGLVEVSWYFSPERIGLLPTAVAFVNLHGNGCDADCKKQIDFLCKICTMHVVLLEDTMLEDAKKESTITLLQQLSQFKIGVPVIVLTTNKSEEQLEGHVQRLSLIRYERNVHALSQRILKKIFSNLKKGASHLPLIHVTDIAKNCSIETDEDSEDYLFGNELAEKMHSLITKENNSRKILHLWHQWTSYNKGKHRQKRKNSQLVKPEMWERGWVYVESGREELTKEEYYYEWIQQQLQPLRCQQLHLDEDMTTLMTTLVNTDSLTRDAVWYFMLNLKLKLDDLFKMKYKKGITHKPLSERNSLENDLRNYGVEHLLREIGQIYEALVEQEHPSISPEHEHKIRRLPRIAAKLLFEGFPIEIYDGDASHVPQTWVSAVLNSLSDIVNDKVSDARIFTLSVLGVQSTGKSTLLNTLFGTQFSVSAGRCTRGAFMQLIPVHPSMWEKMGVHYILVIDTEGLRAPELERLDTHEHDNELATFVVGMANLTLITANGESMGEMENILPTVAHALLRMRNVQLKPSCYMIYQNVQQGVRKKLNQGRSVTKRHLDNVTQYSAREVGQNYTSFSDVITYNCEEDEAFFPALWNGKLPMAHVSSEYSEQAQILKHDLMTKYIPKVRASSILEIKARIEGLWKGILQEDFVFSFKDPLEIEAYRIVDVQFSDWSWGFKKEMIEWEKMAQNKLMHCTEEELQKVHNELTGSLNRVVYSISAKYETKMMRVFEENRRTMKCEPSTKQRLKNLSEEMKNNAINHCEQLRQVRQDCTIAEKKREKISKLILEKVQQLVNKIENKAQNDEVLLVFEENWIEWLRDLTDEVKCLPTLDIHSAVENSLIDFFTADSMLLHSRLEAKNLKEWSDCLELTVVESHYHADSLNEVHTRIQEHTNQTLKFAREHLDNLYEQCASDRDFRPQFATELLHLLRGKNDGNDLAHILKKEYHIDVALTACGCAIPAFVKIADAFRKKHDPLQYIENEIKPHLQKLFVDKYNEVDNAKTATETLCGKLKEPIQHAVYGSLVSQIYDGMREDCPWIKTKHAFIGRILLEIGRNLDQKSNEGFNIGMKFLTNAEESLQYWVMYFTETYCDSESRLSMMSIAKLSNITKFLVEKAKAVTTYVLKEDQTFSFSVWMRRFHNGASPVIAVPAASSLCLLEGQQDIKNAEFFMREIEKRLTAVQDELKDSFQTIKYSAIKLEGREKAVHEVMYKEIAGCTAQCPFCKAQCEFTDKYHMSTEEDTQQCHRTEHRPQCFGNFRWAQDSTMIMDVCPHLVAGFQTFRNDRTNGEWVQYKHYRDYYPEWYIPAQLKCEASIYWKWIIANYSDELETHFKFSKSEVPRKWCDITWEEVERWLKTKYKLLA